jgi:hypothetical protein
MATGHSSSSELGSACKVIQRWDFEYQSLVHQLRSDVSEHLDVLSHLRRCQSALRDSASDKLSPLESIIVVNAMHASF